MAYTVRPANLDADAEAIIRLLADNLNPAYDRARFDWLYRRNPDGPARAWVLVDTLTGAVAGTAAAIPRQMLVAGHEEPAWILSDFCVAERHRALGPALQLQRACLEPVRAGEIGFCYDFPSAGMMAVYRRLGISPLGQLRRFARPLRLRVDQIAGSRTLGQAVATTSRLLLKPGRRRRGDWEMTFHDGGCGPEFSILAGGDRRHSGLRVKRSGDYLGWRFLANPFQPHEILTARRGSTLVGYAVIASENDAATVVDLSTGEDEGLLSSFVADVVAVLHRRGAAAISMHLLESDPWVAVLGQLGFRPRETSPVVAYLPETSPSAARTVAPAAWRLLQGDRDS